MELGLGLMVVFGLWIGVYPKTGFGLAELLFKQLGVFLASRSVESEMDFVSNTNRSTSIGYASPTNERHHDGKRQKGTQYVPYRTKWCKRPVFCTGIIYF